MNVKREHTAANAPAPSGVITRMVRQQKSPQRVSVYLNDAFAFGLHEDLVLHFGLRKGMVLSEDQVTEMLAADGLMKARGRAIRFIAYRPRSEVEVRRRLERAGYEADAVETVVEGLRKNGLIDDRRFAADYAESRFRSRGYGRERLRMELLRKGIARDMAEEALNEVLGEVDLVEAAREAAERRWPRLQREPDPYKRLQKLYQFLLRQGFEMQVVQAIVDSYRKGASRHL